MQHGEGHEHGREQELVRRRVEHRAELALPAETLGEKAVGRVGYGRGDEQREGRDQLAVQQRERYRYHQQDSERGDAVRDLSEPSSHEG